MNPVLTFFRHETRGSLLRAPRRLTKVRIPHRTAPSYSFLALSLVLHGIALGGGACWYAAYRPPVLELAQGMASLELVNASSMGQGGSGDRTGEGLTRQNKTVAESTVAPIEPVNQENAASHSTEEPRPQKTARVPEPSDSPDAQPVTATQKTSDDTPTAPAPSPAPRKAIAAASENGHGKTSAQKGNSAPGVFQPGTPGGVAATALHNPTPPYPEAARRQGVEGFVVLRLNIDMEGHVSRAEVLHSSGRGDFDHAAVTTVEKKWRYRPASSWGHPVESSETVRVCFVLGNA